MLQTTVQDIQYGLRLLRRSPLFTLTAALSLAIGIGANTTIFSIASALLLRPLPGLTDPSRLVDVGRTQNGQGFDNSSYPNYRDYRERQKSLTDVYAIRVDPQPFSLATATDAQRIYGHIVSANYFTILGVRPLLGRLLQDSDDAPDHSHSVVVLSHELWTKTFASDPSIVGQTISLNSKPFMVIGVAPPGFQGTTLLKPDAWTPIAGVADTMPRASANIVNNRAAVWLVMGGRLKDDVTIAQANAEARAIGANLEKEYPNENRGKSLTVTRSALLPGQTVVVAGFLGLLVVIVGLVLSITCVNVAGMLLARAATRRREIAVRLAIGAGRGRLIRQLLTETMILFVAGGLAGLVLTNWLTRVVLAVIPRLPVPIDFTVRADWRVVSFAIAISFIAAVLSGLAPALQSSRADLVPALKAEGLDSGKSRLRLRNIFVVGQVTMSLMLVIVAGLFLRALEHAAAIQPGFDERGVDVIQLDLSLSGYTAETARPFVRELLERTRALPGVDSATLSVDLPLDGGRMGLGGLKVPGKTPPRGEFFSADWNVSEPGLFTTLRLPLIRGRDFTHADTASSMWVAIVNDALAAQYWPGEDPIGKQVLVDDDVPSGAPQTLRPVTIVGVTANARLIWLTGSVEPYIYVPFAQRYIPRVSLLVRRTGDRSAIPDVRALLRSLNPNLPITESMTLSELTAIGLIPQRIAATVAGSLGLVGLLLCGVGIYGVTSYSVAQRTREIGIRVALGADRGSVLRLILRQGLMLAGIGSAIGVVIAAAGSTLLESLLYGIRGLDPITFGGTCLLFALVTLAASYIPARRATTVDPMVALRAE
jgi:putative ABC transport system permease protein